MVIDLRKYINHDVKKGSAIVKSNMLELKRDTKKRFLLNGRRL